MKSSIIARLLFFGGRYLSTLLTSKQLGDDGATFLAAVAIVEFSRVFFDYGLESSILARRHQKGIASNLFWTNTATFRLLATTIGQVMTTILVLIFCATKSQNTLVPLIASLQFFFLMKFGFLQVAMQTEEEANLKKLPAPLLLAITCQAALLFFSIDQAKLALICTFSFELMAFSYCTTLIKRTKSNPKNLLKATASIPKINELRALTKELTPLGKTALICLFYTRIDAFLVPLIAKSTITEQYFIFQRLASAPLMFFSTIAGASIAKLSAISDYPSTGKQEKQYLNHAMIMALVSGGGLLAASGLAGNFFNLNSIDIPLVFCQSIFLTLQVTNGFLAAWHIAHQHNQQLWIIARNNASLAALSITTGTLLAGILGLSISLCVVEFFCTMQYINFMRKNQTNE